jgi:hypothetical protein
MRTYIQKQEVLRRTNSLLSFDMTRPTKKMTCPPRVFNAAGTCSLSSSLSTGGLQELGGIHRQQGDLICPLLFSQNKKSRLKNMLNAYWCKIKFRSGEQ